MDEAPTSKGARLGLTLELLHRTRLRRCPRGLPKSGVGVDRIPVDPGPRDVVVVDRFDSTDAVRGVTGWCSSAPFRCLSFWQRTGRAASELIEFHSIQGSAKRSTLGPSGAGVKLPISVFPGGPPEASPRTKAALPALFYVICLPTIAWAASDGRPGRTAERAVSVDRFSLDPGRVIKTR